MKEIYFGTCQNKNQLKKMNSMVPNTFVFGSHKNQTKDNIYR